MSEYQYYEFRAIDKPLSEAAMAKLRGITSRAEITSTSLTNEYHFGDFKGDPDKLMAECFDAFLYFANWGTHRLMLRLPRGCLDARTVKPYGGVDTIRVKQRDEHIVLDFWSVDECRDDTWREWQLGEFIPLRADLMAGDLRCLYLAWLAAVEYFQVEDDELEPPVPPGLRDLSGPLSAFAEFLYLDEDMIAAAAEVSAPASASPSTDDKAAWVATLPEAERNDWLVRLMQGESPGVSGEMLARFHRSRKGEPQKSGHPRRSAGSLREAGEARSQKRKQEQAERATRERERRASEQAAARAKHLDSLQGKESTLWRQVDELVATKQARNYDEAVTLIKDLHELWQQRGAGLDFTKSLDDVLLRHSAKSAFKSRVRKAGFEA